MNAVARKSVALGRTVLAIAGTVLLQGCMTVVLLHDLPSEALLNEMREACERDAGVRWVGSRPSGLDLWLPGKLDYEPTAGRIDGVKPYDTFWFGDEDLLREGVARALLVNIAPIYRASDTQSGPFAGDPAGVYRFEMAPASDSRCVRRREAIARTSEPGSLGALYAQDSTRSCAVHTYVGPFDGQARPDMYVRFSDEALEARGLYRDGDRLFVAGRLRAGYTGYTAINPRAPAERRGQWGIEACAPSQGPNVAILDAGSARHLPAPRSSP